MKIAKIVQLSEQLGEYQEQSTDEFQYGCSVGSSNGNAECLLRLLNRLFHGVFTQ